MLARLFLVLLLAGPVSAQTLPGTEPLTLAGDPARLMVDGIGTWLERDAPALAPNRGATAERLRYIIGAVDSRLPFNGMELVAGIDTPAERAPRVRAVRWPVFDGVDGEGLLLEPVGTPIAGVVALPDAGTAPENFAAAQTLAAAGFEVVVPVLIDRDDTWSGNPAIRMTNQPHREFLYRMGFPVGRHIIGYEVQKVMAAVDWLAHTSGSRPLGVWGYGEGGLIALYAGALDSRIAVTGVSGYFGPRDRLAEEPIYRNVWTLLRDFGDARVATLYRGRTLLIDPAPGPVVDGPPPERDGRRGAAPGRLRPVPASAVRAEIDRARAMGAPASLAEGGLADFIRALGGTPGNAAVAPIPVVDAAGRMRRQFMELVRFTERLVRGSQRQRDAYWAKAGPPSATRWKQQSAPYRQRIVDDVIGRLPAVTVAARPRTRLAYRGEQWDGYEVTLDLFAGVFSYGVLLVPKVRRAGERLPVVVAQHGLQGRPQDLFAQPEVERTGQAYSSFHFYQNIGSRLAGMGFVVYMPQNPYTGEFRQIVRQANPYGWSLYSFILAQNDRVLDWLGGLDFVDPSRIAFYGLSYGGKVAVRIPPLLDRYAASICSGDFNEWVYKLAAYEEPFSYLFTIEYEMPEWNLGHIASHAEMAWLMAPRPFMVERGHNDGVGTDEWVAHEYARVQRFYDQMGIGEQTQIEYFDGPHQIHGEGTVAFLIRYLQPSRR